MKVGILGGTFDPIHIGHQYMAEESMYLLNLSKILVIPNGDPPHKDNKVTDSEIRYNMVSLAFENNKNIEVNRIEIDSKDKSYTYLTLSKLKENEYKNDDLYFILGADSLINFEKWKNPKDILKLVTIVCLDRPNYRVEEKEKAKNFIEKNKGRVIILDSLDLEISSTDIRNRIRDNKPYKFLLSEKVKNYIEINSLYKDK